MGIVLDWYHLDKKCKEQLSIALRGRRIRNEFLDGLMPLLWHGLTEEAIAHLEGIEMEKIKNREVSSKLIAYLQRNSSFSAGGVIYRFIATAQVENFWSHGSFDAAEQGAAKSASSSSP